MLYLEPVCMSLNLCICVSVCQCVNECVCMCSVFVFLCAAISTWTWPAKIIAIIQECLGAAFTDLNVNQIFTDFGSPLHRLTDKQTRRHADTQTHRHINTQTNKHTDCNIIMKNATFWLIWKVIFQDQISEGRHKCARPVSPKHFCLLVKPTKWGKNCRV